MTTTTTIDNTPLKLAAPAPLRGEDDETSAQTDQDRDLDALCEAWVQWRLTRRLYGPPPQFTSLLGKLSGKRRTLARVGGPDAPCSAELAAFHVAYLCQPDALDKQVFELHYWHRVKPIKAAARALGIERRQHWYELLNGFRRRVNVMAQAIVAENEARLGAMRSGAAPI
jgi:hypothetical protein